MTRFAEDTTVEAERRRRWRALALVVKAKLEAIATGISTFEDEFLAHLVPDGQTIAQHLKPQLENYYAGGDAPRLLGPGGPR